MKVLLDRMSLPVRKSVISMLLQPAIISEDNDSSMMERYMDEDMINYINDNLNDPNRKAQFLKAVKRYGDMAKRETDPWMAMYYEYRMYLPDAQAKALAYDFYNRERNSGTYNASEFENDYDDDISATEIFDSAQFGNSGADYGMFNQFTSGVAYNPAKLISTDDLFDKLFKSPHLQKEDRIVLIVNLMFGSGPGLRAAKTADSFGLDLREVMSKAPKEVKEVEAFIKQLKPRLLPNTPITRDYVLSGVAGDLTVEGKFIPGIVGSRRKQAAQQNLQKAVADLVGSDNLTNIVRMLVQESLNTKSVEEASDDKRDNVAQWVSMYISGRKLDAHQMIAIIVSGVNANLKNKTALTKSAEFKGNLKTICKRYFDMAKKGGVSNVYHVQNMIMAPILDSIDKRKTTEKVKSKLVK